MSEWTTLLSCLPHPPDYLFRFDALEHTVIGPVLRAMTVTPQSPLWHGEGDVLAHTKLVCMQLSAMPAFRALDADRRNALALAALLHDAGKPKTTRQENGDWSSPGHSVTGAHIVRTLLWQALDLCGTPEKQQLREAVCLLVRYHMQPLHLIDQEEPERRIARLASNGALTPLFSIKLLCLLARADVLGRVAPDTLAGLQAVELCEQLAGEVGCLDGPLRFASDHTQHAWLSGRNVLPDQPLFDDAWGEVLLLSGLPGTGKDTWLRAHCADLPMVSMDQLREAMGVKPTDDQGRIAQAAQEACRAHLRAKQPFVFNTTSLTPMMRGKSIRLFESYGAAVRIVYLETGWAEQLRRNGARQAAVPESALARMLDTLIPPERFEARGVEWRCI